MLNWICVSADEIRNANEILIRQIFGRMKRRWEANEKMDLKKDGRYHDAGG